VIATGAEPTFVGVAPGLTVPGACLPATHIILGGGTPDLDGSYG
jgi:hypothetical protein